MAGINESTYSIEWNESLTEDLMPTQPIEGVSVLNNEDLPTQPVKVEDLSVSIHDNKFSDSFETEITVVESILEDSTHLDMEWDINESDKSDAEFINDGMDSFMSSISEPSPNPNEVLYDVHGVTVYFPYKAYPSQMDMMRKTITGLQQGQHCLLESPTGTGKTAALLCSLLAWQNMCIQHKNLVGLPLKDDEECSESCKFSRDLKPGMSIRPLPDGRESSEDSESSNVSQSELYGTSRHTIMGKFADVTKPSVKDVDETSSSPAKKLKVQEHRLIAQKGWNDLCITCRKKYYYVCPKSVPTIYYSTRTHSQIDQVVRELKQSHYNHVQMTVLGSRNIQCVNSDVTLKLLTQNTKNKDTTTIEDECRGLRVGYYRNKNPKHQQMKKDEPGEDINSNGSQKNVLSGASGRPWPTCPYFRENVMSEAESFISERDCKVWDIEDLKKYGRSSCACPYYMTKALHERARIVFCPYQYLISPSIRFATKIKFKNSILVFDEAHNIEDTCRDNSSKKFTLNYLLEILAQVDKDYNSKGFPEKLKSHFNALSVLGKALTKWLLEENYKQEGIDALRISDSKSIFEKESIEKQFIQLNITSQTVFFVYSGVMTALREYPTPDDVENADDPVYKLPQNVLNFFGSFINSLMSLYAKGKANLDHYVLIRLRTVKPDKISGKLVVGNSPQKVQDCFIENMNYEYRLICLNPGISFESINKNAHSVIVASGTLSPLASFESELCCKFEQQLSADHVVERQQVLAAIVGSSSGSNSDSQQMLEFSYKDRDKPECLTGLGDVVLHVCRTVPKGVLLFFSSYDYMNLVLKNWKSYPPGNTAMSQLEQLKRIFFEPRTRNKDEFVTFIEQYRSHITSSTEAGAILFAVFRGKVSEGVDFKDDQARAVITVGIPFANIKDVSIEQKRLYNDRQKQTNPKFLDGSEWYSTQAMRAMNQALGRCVRHKNDWGCVIMADQRLKFGRYNKHISKWIQDFLKIDEADNFDLVKNHLSSFLNNRNKLKEAEIKREELKDNFHKAEAKLNQSLLDVLDDEELSDDGC